MYVLEQVVLTSNCSMWTAGLHERDVWPPAAVSVRTTCFYMNDAFEHDLITYLVILNILQ